MKLLTTAVIRKFVFFSLLTFVQSADNRVQRSTNCKVSLKDIKALHAAISQRIGETGKSSSECEPIMPQVINVSSRLRNILRKQVAEFSKQFNETETRLLKEQQSVAQSLANLPSNVKKEYGRIFVGATNKIKTIRESIETEIREQMTQKVKLGFYAYYLDAVKTMPSSDTSCDLVGDTGKKILSILNELYLALVEKSFPDDCKSLIKEMTNIEVLMTQRENRNQKRLQLLEKTFAKRTRFAQKLVDDNVNKERDFENLGENFDELRKLLNNEMEITGDIEDQVSKQAFKFAVQMIGAGDNLRESMKVLSEAQDDEIFSKAIVEAYNCDESKLTNVIKFLDVFYKTGFATVGNEIRRCNHLSNPVVLKIAHELNDDYFKDSVEKVYTKFAKQVQKEETEHILTFIKSVNSHGLDYIRLIQKSYGRNTKNFEAVTTLIDQLDLRSKNLETIFYTEMLESGHVDTAEHVMFGFWIMEKINLIEQQPQQYISELHKLHLEQLKERFPEGIKLLFFEPYVIFARENFSYLMRAFGHDSVKFKAIPYFKGRHFRFNDTRDNRSLFVTEISGNQVVLVGKGDNRNYYWQIIPTQNAKFFYIVNYFNDSAMSSEEYQHCDLYERWVSEWFDGYIEKVFKKKCKKTAIYNVAKGKPYTESQKWMITTSLIRNGILQDRTRSRV